MDLQKEIQDYKINKNTVDKLSRDAIQQYPDIEPIKSRAIPLTVFCLLLLCLSLPLLKLASIAFFVILGILIIGYLASLYILKRKLNLTKEKYKTFFKITNFIEEFNTLIDELDALLESKEASKKLQNTEELLEILGLIRSDLICSLKLDKVYRENPNYKGSRLIINDMSSEEDFSTMANQIYSKSNEMENFINQLSDIRQSIRDIHNI